jgi:uncharacterized protein (DUF111 family)
VPVKILAHKVIAGTYFREPPRRHSYSQLNEAGIMEDKLKGDRLRNKAMAMSRPAAYGSNQQDDDDSSSNNDDGGADNEDAITATKVKDDASANSDDASSTKKAKEPKEPKAKKKSSSSFKDDAASDDDGGSADRKAERAKKKASSKDDASASDDDGGSADRKAERAKKKASSSSKDDASANDDDASSDDKAKAERVQNKAMAMSRPADNDDEDDTSATNDDDYDASANNDDAVVVDGWELPAEPMHAHFDCFSGAAGDMMLAACFDVAADDRDRLMNHVSKCISKGMPELKNEFSISCNRVRRGVGSIAGTHVTVKSLYNHEAAPVPNDHDHSHEHTHGSSNGDNGAHSHEHGHAHAQAHSSSGKGPLRNLPDIRKMLQDAPSEWIPVWVRDTAIDVFTALAKAEATVHGVGSIDAVHFHEVGAVDSIVDTVGTLLALYFLGATTFSCSRLPLGEGTVKTDHGLLPVPAPATLYLTMGMPLTAGPPGPTGELLTPTAAALLRVLTANPGKAPMVGKPPIFTLRGVGVGAGTKDFRKHPNILRLLLGDDLILNNEQLMPY